MTGKEPSVLFVCTANICRSPMAEALFKDLAAREIPGGENWKVDSAGTWAFKGQGASENSIKVLAKRGLDISRHRSKIVTAGMLNSFDLILVMEPGHKEALKIEFGSAARRVFLLSEMSGPPVTINDPYGSSEEDYEKTCLEIEGYLKAGLPKIIEVIGNSQ